MKRARSTYRHRGSPTSCDRRTVATLDERCFTDRGAHRKGLKASEICSSSRGPLSSVRRKENAYREVDTRRGKLESRPEKSSDRRVARVGLVRQKGVR